MKSNLKNVLVLFDVKHPYDRQIIDGIMGAVHDSNENYAVTLMAYDEALLVASDTIWDAIIVDLEQSKNIELCKTLNAPVVGVISNMHELELNFPAVIYICPDTQHICLQAKNHLEACGIENFGFFSGLANDIGDWSEDRKQRFKKLVLEADLNWIGDYNTHTVRDHFSNEIKPRTGYLCASDTQARQLITLAYNLNIDVPGDISIMGIDNDEIENQLSRVPISTIALNPSDIGKQAFQALSDLKLGDPDLYKLVPSGDVVNRLSAYVEVGDDALVAKALKYIYRQYHRPINAAQVIAECETSRNTLEKRFKKVLDKTIHQVLYDFRIKKAKDLLINSQKPLEEIAIKCGLSSTQYLYYMFRKEVGMTPTKYRELNANKED